MPILNILLFRRRSGTIRQIALQGGVVKASANLGCILGQIGFGLLGDMFGRRRVWPAGLVVTIIGTVLMIAAPLSVGAVGVFTWITVARVIMGIGIGGDYPMSSAAISDRSSTNRRGMLLAFTFSMQGWGNLAGGIVTIIVLSAYKSSIQAGEVSKLVSPKSTTSIGISSADRRTFTNFRTVNLVLQASGTSESAVLTSFFCFAQVAGVLSLALSSFPV